MKKMWSLFMIITLSIVLVACGPKEETAPYVKAGDDAMVDENFEKAIKSYASAYNIDNHEDILAKLRSARESRYQVLREEYSVLKDGLYHKKASDKLEEMMKFKDFMTEDDIERYGNEEKELKDLSAAQQRLDDYIVWAKPYVLELSDISNDWFTVSRSIELGGVTNAKIEKDISDLIIRNQKVLGDIETKSLNVEPTLSETHQILYDIVLNNDSGFTSTLGALRTNKPAEEVVNAGEKADIAKKDIANFTTKIRTYASDNNLRDTFQEILTSTEKSEPTEKTDSTESDEK